MEDWIKHIKDNKIIAIDPGQKGGIAVFSVDAGKVISLVKMPESPQDLYNYLKKYSTNSRCYLEKVGGITGSGGANSMFNFGKGFGHLEMCLIVLKIPTNEVTPQKWQKSLQLGHNGDKTTDECKTKLKIRAQQLFPYVEHEFALKNKTAWLNVSDALLMLEYARKEEIK